MKISQDQNPERLSVQLKRVADRFGEQSISLGELLQALRGSHYLLLIAILSLPFLVPIPLIGLSIPIGILFALFGLQFALGQKPFVPQRLQKVQLSPKFFPTLLRVSSRILQFIEFFSRPRLAFLSDKGILMNFYGILIFIMAICFSLPLPVPFANFFPALTLLFLSLGLIERDGIFLLLGMLFSVITVAFFILIFWGGKEVLQALWEKIT